jgi:hypothetical protein
MDEKSAQTEPCELADDGVHVELTHASLDMLRMMRLVKRDDAGAVVTFTGAPVSSMYLLP